MTYYNKSKVKDIIKNYHHMTQQIQSFRKEYASVGVTVYNEEAVMPRANTISDVTANEAIRHCDDVKVIADFKTDIKYLQDRLDRVNEQDEELLTLFLAGYNIHDVANYYSCSLRTVDRKLDDIADCIVSVI